MRIGAFITVSAYTKRILDLIWVEPEAPCIPPARGPPLWGIFAAHGGEGGANSWGIKLATVDALVF